MKGCIVYYSLDGHTKKLAEEIAKINNYELMEIEPVKPMKYKGFLKILIGGMWAVRKKQLPIKPVKDINEYEHIILGTPVWADRIPPYMRTFLSENRISGKKVSVFVSCGGGQGNVYNIIKEMIPENEFIGLFWKKEKDTTDTIRLETFAKV